MRARVRTPIGNQSIRRACVLVTSAVLIASVLGSSSAVAEEPKASTRPDSGLVKATDSDNDDTLDAPDTASATAAAVAKDVAVEDLSQRSETTTVVVNPDGTHTSRQHQVPVRVERDGSWLDIDETLEKQADGSYRPKVSATDIVIGGGGSKNAGKVTFDDGRSVAVTWPETLPEPTIDGGVATYKLSDAADLLMSVGGTGVAARLRLNTKPATDDPVFSFGLRTDDLNIAENTGGGLTLKDDQGKAVGGTAELVAWDARTDEAGAPLEKVTLDVDLEQTGKSGDVATHKLDLTTPEGFLTDPATKYPVIIDPDVTGLEAARDTWVRQNDTASHGTDTYLSVGKMNTTGNTAPAISLMQWHLGKIPAGSTVVSARLLLHQFYAGTSTCTPALMFLEPLNSNWNADTTYTGLPNGRGVDYGYLSENKGYQCAAPNGPGRVSIPATTWINSWRNGTYPNYGIQLRIQAASQNSSSFHRRFCSYQANASDGNCPNSTYTPALEVTYDNNPNTPYNVNVTSGGNPATVYATVSDINSESSLKARLNVTKASTGASVWTGMTNAVAVSPNQTLEVKGELPYLPDGDYEVRATTVDTRGSDSFPSTATKFSIETEFGLQSWFSTTQHRLNDRSALAVNNRTGNLVVQANDISVNGLGLDFNATRFYNSQSTQTNTQGVISASDRWFTSLGTGWSLSAGPDVWLQKSGSNFDYHAPGGTVFGPFKPNAADSSKFDKPAGGVGADLSKDGSTYTLKFRKSQLRYEFKEYGTAGHLFQTKMRDKSGNEINFAYSGTTPNGRAKLGTITDASGRVFSVVYEGDYIKTITNTSNPAGTSEQAWNYTYETDGRLKSFAGPDQQLTEYEYVSSPTTNAKLLSKIADPVNQSGTRPTTSFVYFGNSANADRIDKVNYQMDATNARSFSWDYKRRKTDGSCNTGADYSTTVKDARSKDTAYCFHDSNDVDAGGKVRVYDALGNMKTTSYTADRAVKSVTTPMNQAAGRSTTAEYGAGAYTDRLNTITEPQSAEDESTGPSVTKFGYGSSPLPGTERLPRSATRADGTCSAYEYDSAGRTTAAYSGITSQNDACAKDGKKGAHRRYNSNGTVNESWDANGFEASQGDDDEPTPEGKTIYTYWSTNDTGYVANTSGQLKTIRKPGGSCDAPRKLCTSYTYDARARVKSVTDGRGKQTTYTYDAMDRTIGTYFNGATSCAAGNTNCVQYTYDAEGNLVSRADKAGTSTFVYDRLNRQTKQTLPGVVIDMAYDGNGNLTTHTQTLTGQSAQTVTYSYDDANRVTMVHSDGIGAGDGGDISISPDHDGRVKQIGFPGLNGVLMNYNYTKFGKPKSANVKAKDAPAGTDPKRAFIYDYNLAVGSLKVTTDKLRKRTIDFVGVSNDEIIEYEYADDRLESAANDNGPDFEYTHDKIGNVTSEATSDTTTYFGYDRAGQLCWRGQAAGEELRQTCGAGPVGSTNFSQDAAGNNTNFSSNPTAYNDDSQVSTIDGVNMGYMDRGNALRTTAGATSYTNSPLGITAKKEGANITYYVRDPNGQILASYGAGGKLFYFSESNGSVAAIYNSQGNEVGSYTYSPYGKTTATGTAAQNNPFRYIGGLQDKDSNGSDTYYKLGARYYDAQGHFTQPDSIAGTINDPKTMTPYNYAGGDPINQSDPSGLSVGCSISAGLIGTGVAGLGLLAGGPPGAVAGGSVGSNFVSSACGSDEKTFKGIAGAGFQGVVDGWVSTAILTVGTTVLTALYYGGTGGAG